MKKCKLLVLFVAIALMQPIYAQQTNIDSIKNQKTELQIVTVKALRGSENAPFAKTVISSKQIALQNTGTDLPYLLNNIPNTIASSDAGNGVGYTNIRIRGTDVSRTNVTINGVPVNDAEGQGVFFVNFADIASSTQNVYVQRGVGSSTNGAGAFGASIHLQTIENSSKKYLQIASQLSSFSTWKNTLQYNTGLINKKWIFQTRMSAINSNGYIQRSKSKLISAQSTLTYYANATTNFALHYMGGKEKTQQAWNGVPQDSLVTNRTWNSLGQKSDGTFYDNQTDNYQQHYLQLIFNKKIKNDWAINVTPYYTRGLGYYQEYKASENINNYNLPSYLKDSALQNISDLTRQLWLNNHLLGFVSFASKKYNSTEVNFGISANTYFGKHCGIVKEVFAYTNPIVNKKWYALRAQKSEASAFAKVEFKANDALLYFVDVQARFVQYNIRGFRNNPTLNKDLQWLFFNPKFGIQYVMQDENIQKQKIFTSFAIANKEPNRDDLEAATYNSTPSFETLTDAEFGYTLQNKLIALNATAYYMHYNNQLVYTGKVNDVGAYTRTNTPSSFKTGLELQASAAVLPKKLLITGQFSISKNRIQNFTQYIDNYDSGFQQTINFKNTQIGFTPNIIAGIGITVLPYIKWMPRLDFQHKYIGKQFLDNTANSNRQLSGYYTLDALANYDFKINKTTGTIKAGVYNFTNQLFANNGYTYGWVYDGKYVNNNFYYPQAGIRYTIGFSLLLP